MVRTEAGYTYRIGQTVMRFAGERRRGERGEEDEKAGQGEIKGCALFLLAQVFQQSPVRFVAGFPHHCPRTARTGHPRGQGMGDAQGRPGVKASAMHEGKDCLAANLIGSRVTPPAVLHERQRPATTSPIGSGAVLVPRRKNCNRSHFPVQ